MRSYHILTDQTRVLGRQELIKILLQAGWHSVILDPHDRRPLSSGSLVEDRILLSLHGSDFENMKFPAPSGPPRRILECEAYVRKPYIAEEILGPMHGMKAVLGAEVARKLRKAKVLYAVNSISPRAAKAALGVATAISKGVRGAILEPKKGRLIN